MPNTLFYSASKSDKKNLVPINRGRGGGREGRGNGRSRKGRKSWRVRRDGGRVGREGKRGKGWTGREVEGEGMGKE